MFVALQKYTQQVEIEDCGGFMYHQIQEQVSQSFTTGAITENREFARENFSAELVSGLERQITLAMVMDPASVSSDSALFKQIQMKSKKLFGDGDYQSYNTQRIVTLTASAIKESKLESMLSNWAQLFLATMKSAEDGSLLS